MPRRGAARRAGGALAGAALASAALAGARGDAGAGAGAGAGEGAGGGGKAALDALLAQVDFPTLSTDPSQLIALLPQLGLSQACQGAVIGAGATCLPDIQSVATGLIQDPTVGTLIASYTNSPDAEARLQPGPPGGGGGSNSSAPGGDGAATPSPLPALPDSAIESLIDQILPKVRELLPAKDPEGAGMVSRACCEALAPVVTNACLCSRRTMELVYALLSQDGPQVTDLNPFLKFFVQVMDRLECRAADALVAWPSAQCPAS